MSTIATPAMRTFADAWESALPSAVLSGIVGDRAHAASGGYHISREDQSGGNYSVQLAEDRAGPSNAASAVDMNHNPAEMKLVTGRLLASARDQNDPRLNYCREFYGTLDGRTVTGWDTYYGNPASSDDSHLWHVHVSFLRQYAGDPAAMAAVLSVIKGQPYGTGPTPPTGGIEMELGTVVPRASEAGFGRTVEMILADVWRAVHGPAQDTQATVHRLEAAAAADATRDAAMLAAIQAISGAGGVEAAPIVAAIREATERVRSEVLGKLDQQAKAAADLLAQRLKE